jgi:hypothetical protein
LANLLTSTTASAGIFRIDNLFGVDSLGELQGIYGFKLAYGARYRLNDRDRPIVVAISEGSNPQNSLLDDGNFNLIVFVALLRRPFYQLLSRACAVVYPADLL